MISRKYRRENTPMPLKVLIYRVSLFIKQASYWDQSMNYLCKSGVGLATAMLELRRLEGVGDFGPSTLAWPWLPVNEVRWRRTSTSLLRLWKALLLHRLLFESAFEVSCFLKDQRWLSTKINWTLLFTTRTGDLNKLVHVADECFPPICLSFLFLGGSGDSL